MHRILTIVKQGKCHSNIIIGKYFIVICITSRQKKIMVYNALMMFWVSLSWRLCKVVIFIGKGHFSLNFYRQKTVISRLYSNNGSRMSLFCTKSIPLIPYTCVSQQQFFFELTLSIVKLD